MVDNRALHLTLARALAASQPLSGGRGGAAELSHHWYSAGRWDESLAAAIRAGIEAENVHAPREALTQFERALELWDRVDPGAPELSRIALAQHASENALLAGAAERAIALGRDTLGRLRPADRVTVALAHERLGRYLWVAGRGEAALAEYRLAVELMPSAVSRERALVLAAEAQALMLSSLTELSETRCEQALEIAAGIGADEIRARVLNTVCSNLANAGEFERAAESSEEALRIARRLGLVEEVGRAHVNGSSALDQEGEVVKSIALAQRGLDTAHTLGADRRYGDFLRAEIARRRIRTGGWDEAERSLAELSESVATGVNSALVHLGTAELRAERGERDLALDAVREAERHTLQARSSLWSAPAAAARAIVELWDGDPEAALRTIGGCLHHYDRGEHIFYSARLHELGVRAHADLTALAPDDEVGTRRETARSRALLARLDGLIAGLTGRLHPRVRAERAGCVAELTRITGPDPEAWARAQRHAEAVGDVYKVAYTQWRQAEALIHRDEDQGRVGDLIQRARQTAEALRAEPLRQAIEVLGRAAGVDRDGERPPERTGVGARFDLTPRETEVLGLLSQGMSNREIAAVLVISDKTASVHVSRILSKLSVPNRASAAVLAHRLEATGGPE